MKNNQLYYLSEDCCFDRENCRIIDANHQTKHQLTSLQYKVLDILVQNVNNILKYDQIIDSVWDIADSAYQRNLADVIYQLRSIDDTLKTCIETRRNLGFSLRCDYHQPQKNTSYNIQIVSSRMLENFGYTSIQAAKKLLKLLKRKLQTISLKTYSLLKRDASVFVL
jgi:DNA-binding winged helix-turn-helix (wHTH) protein